MFGAARPSVHPPYDEFLEPDVAVSFSIGDIEVEQAFLPRDVAVHPDKKSVKLFRIDEAIAVEIARVECLAQLCEFLIVQF